MIKKIVTEHFFKTKIQIHFSFLSVLVILANQNVFAQLDAFPGAEGYGRYTTGGRGGVVYEVTNLNDSGTGSLRDAIGKTGPRTIVFRVSGNIALKDYLKISKGDVTIAGQTAPGDGICLSNYTLSVQANNVIVRFIKSRLGDTTIVRNSLGTPLLNSLGLPLHVEDDAAHGMGTYKDIIIDHCTFSWSIDETASFYGNENFTMQWCLISESLSNSFHSKGRHGYGGIWGGTNATFHHNLLAHHYSRNPRFSGNETATAVNVDFRNNVIYNWANKSSYGGEKGKINIVANYYKYGPATESGKNFRIVEPYDTAGRWYISGNYVFGNSAVTLNNWNGGVQGSYASYQSLHRAVSPFPYKPITEQIPEVAIDSVLKNVGACFPKRDIIDERVINETRTGTAAYGNKGIIDSQNNVGGWPVLNSSPAPDDLDHDGMPDDWEVANRLNPNDASDRNNIAASGYTMLEVYLNGLVSNVIVTSLGDDPVAVPSVFKLFQNYPNPFNPETTIQFITPSAGEVEVNIFDINGREISKLFKGIKNSGLHNISWNGISESGNRVASGVYLCKVSFNKFYRTQKLLLLK